MPQIGCKVSRKLSRLVALSLALILVTGCVSTTDLRAMTPTRSFTSQIAPGPLSDCILAEMTALDRDDTYRRSAAPGVIHVTADQGSQSLALLDIAIIPLEAGSRIELRVRGNVWGGTNEPDEATNIIQGCASR